MVTAPHPKPDLGGIHAVLYALFDREERLDLNAMRDQAALMMSLGMDGITVLGLATEVQKLDLEERLSVIRQVGKTVAGSLPYSVTVSGNSVAEQRRLTEYAIDHGADLVILQPPLVGQFHSSEYISFFLRVADGFDVRFAIQNAPQYLGRALTDDDIAQLTSANPMFQVVKAECSAIDLANLSRVAGPDLTLLNGRGGLEMTDCLRAGADGFILAPDAIDFARTTFQRWADGDHVSADQTFARALPAITFVMQSIEHLICYGKRLFGARAGFQIHDRGPCLRPDDFGLRLTQHWADYLGPLGDNVNERL